MAERNLRLLQPAPPPPTEPDIPSSVGYQTPLTEQEWYVIRPRGTFYARRVDRPSRWRGRDYPAGSYYIYLQSDQGIAGTFSEVLSEIEFRRRYAITDEAGYDHN